MQYSGDTVESISQPGIAHCPPPPPKSSIERVRRPRFTRNYCIPLLSARTGRVYTSHQTLSQRNGRWKAWLRETTQALCYDVLF